MKKASWITPLKGQRGSPFPNIQGLAVGLLCAPVYPSPFPALHICQGEAATVIPTSEADGKEIVQHSNGDIHKAMAQPGHVM